MRGLKSYEAFYGSWWWGYYLFFVKFPNSYEYQMGVRVLLVLPLQLHQGKAPPPCISGET